MIIYNEFNPWWDETKTLKYEEDDLQNYFGLYLNVDENGNVCPINCWPHGGSMFLCKKHALSLIKEARRYPYRIEGSIDNPMCADSVQV